MTTRLSTFTFRLSTRASSRGFTLVELLVSIVIFTVMTSVVLAKYRTFDTNAKFANASEDIVLALRQAQVYGVGVKGQGSSFTTPYGVYFDATMPNQNQIVIFADTDPPGSPISGDGKYTASLDSLIDTIKWGSTISLSRLLCDGVDCNPSNASVTFKRPNPDAIIKNSSATFSTLSVVLRDTSSGKTATTTITNAGQISLQ